MAKFPEIESAVVSLDKQVKQLITDLQSLINAVNSNSKSQVDLTNKTNAVTKATGQISAVEKELENIRKRGLKVTKETITAKENLRKRTKDLTDQVRKEQGTFKKSGGLFRSMTKSILTAGAAMFGLRSAFNVLKKGLKTIIAFEKGMSEVRAITGATSKEFKELKSNALLLGSTTAKTSLEVAGLQKEFAKLGFTTPEILAATEATINLSIAAGSDLAESATVAASTIRGFGLSATESTRIVDVMAKSFTSSALDLEKFKTAMATVAPVAKSAGKDIEFTTAQIAVLADAGLDASTAGTSLRNIFLELNKQGLTWEQGLEKINTSTNKNVTALNLFGKRGATAALILADNTKKAIDLEAAFDDAGGTAKEMADIMADNLAGDITLASSAWEGFVLSISEGSNIINKSLRGIVQFSTQALTAVSSMGIFYRKTANLTEQDAKKILATLENISIGVSDRVQAASSSLKNATKDDVIPAMNELSLALQEQGFSFEKAQKIARLTAIARAKELKALQDAQKEAEIKSAEEAARVKAEIAKEAAKKTADDQLKIDEEVEQERLTAFQAAKKKQEELDLESDKKLIERKTALLEGSEEERKAAMIQALQEEYDIKIATAEKIAQREKEINDAKNEVKIAAAEAAGQILSDQFSGFIDNNLAAFEAGQDAERKILDDKLDKGELSEEDYQKKILALEKKGRIESAKAEKKKAIFDATIAAAVSVIKQLAATPLPAGAPFIAAAAAIGAAQIGVAVAQPIPKFKHGTNGELQLDTTAIVGDGAGDSRELVTTPQGSFISPSKDTMVHLPKGSQVFSHNSPETQAVLSGGMTEEMYQGLINEQRLTRKAISSQPKSVTSLTDKGLEKAYITKQRKINLLDEYIRS